MTKYGETNDFKVEDFINVLEKYIWEGRIGYVLVNSGEHREDLLEKYKTEKKIPVKIGNHETLANKGIKVIERDFLSATDYIRHDPRKLARAIEDFASGWIK